MGQVEGEGVQNKQQHEVDAKAMKVEMAISSKRGNMIRMLGKCGGLAMKKTGDSWCGVR